jgi:SLOG in TRPM, prokaryote
MSYTVKLHHRNARNIHVVPKEHVVHKEEELSLGMFGLKRHLPTLTLVGDTKYNESDMRRLRSFFSALAEALTQQDFPVAVIDGATNFGVMRLFGDVCEEIGKRPEALIGVTLRVAVKDENMQPEPHHSDVILIPGDREEWIAEVPWIQRVQSVVSGGKPSVLLAVGGGLVTLRHMQAHASVGVPLYVLLDDGPLSWGFVQARNGISDPEYRFSIDEHKNLLATSSVTFLDPANSQGAINKLMERLYKTRQEISKEASGVSYRLPVFASGFPL